MDGALEVKPRLWDSSRAQEPFQGPPGLPEAAKAAPETWPSSSLGLDAQRPLTMFSAWLSPWLAETLSRSVG